MTSIAAIREIHQKNEKISQWNEIRACTYFIFISLGMVSFSIGYADFGIKIIPREMLMSISAGVTVLSSIALLADCCITRCVIWCRNKNIVGYQQV